MLQHRRYKLVYCSLTRNDTHPAVLCSSDLGQLHKVGQYCRIVDVQVLLELPPDRATQRLQSGVCQVSICRALLPQDKRHKAL